MPYSVGMFIKKTTKTDSATGKTYCTYQLVESVRTPKGPRQRVLLYMGADIGLPESEHWQLAQCISEQLAGTQCLIQHPEHIERAAQKYVSQILNHLSVPNNSAKPPESAEFVPIDVNSVEKSEPRSIGAEHLMLEMAHQLKLPEQLAKLGLSKKEQATALGSIIARAVNPDSELSTYAWLCNESGLGELLNFDFKNISLRKLYETGLCPFAAQTDKKNGFIGPLLNDPQFPQQLLSADTFL